MANLPARRKTAKKSAPPRKQAAPEPSRPTTDAPTAPSAFYVYCLGELSGCRAAAQEPLPAAIEGGEIEVVACGTLAAVASPVPLSDYRQASLQHKVNQASWMASRALRHEEVVKHFSSRATVAPLRFGAIYLNRSRIRQTLQRQAPQLRKILRKLRGSDEWGLTVFYDPAAAPVPAPVSRPKRSNRSDANPGHAYLQRKKMESNQGRMDLARVKELVRSIETQLAELSHGSARLRVHKGDASEYGRVTARLAFLVPRETFPRFRDAADRIARRDAAEGMRLELTGPWPPYTFVTD